MQVVTVTVGILATNCYLVVDDGTMKAAVIDPGDSGVAVGEKLAGMGAEPSAIILTHGHVDHIGGVSELARQTGAPVRIHDEDRIMLSTVDAEFATLLPRDYEPPETTATMDDGDEIEIGGMSISVIHTPGHTPGSCSLLADGHLFTGDLLFAGSVGRTDLPGGDSRTLARSLSERIMTLPDETVIHPGHGPETTLGEERISNPFLMPERLRWSG